MQIEFQCKKCLAFLTTDSQHKGHDANCEFCQNEQRIPLQGSIEIGNIIEDHLIQQEIGQGAMGKVYLARHLLMNRQVAIKTISQKIRQNKGAVGQFIQELQMGAQLIHPNIVTVYNAGYCDGVYYISMQYIDGLDIVEWVEDKGPLSEKEALTLTMNITNAMSYAWTDCQMIHRDIKPENIRITSHGDVMIMDFGLAKMRSNEEQGGKEETIIGTPDFMSPEQAQREADIDFRADIYALGVVLIYLLTAKRPFQDPDPLNVVAMHMTKPMPSIKTLNPAVRVSEQTIKLIERMTAKDRDERFTSWEKVSEAINRILTLNKTKSGVITISKTKAASPTRVRRRQSSDLRTVSLIIIILCAIIAVIFVIQKS